MWERVDGDEVHLSEDAEEFAQESGDNPIFFSLSPFRIIFGNI